MGVLIALTVVSALALVALKLVARRASATAGMRVVGRLALEARRSIYLVDVGGRCFLVGVGDGPMTMLAEVEPPAQPAVDEEPAADDRMMRAWRRVLGGRA